MLNGYNSESVETANRLGGLNGNSGNPHNDQYDAFRHAYTSALMTQQFGDPVAKWLGDLNERPYDPQGPLTLQEYNAERSMDLWNNNVGRQEYHNWRACK